MGIIKKLLTKAVVKAVESYVNKQQTVSVEVQTRKAESVRPTTAEKPKAPQPEIKKSAPQKAPQPPKTKQPEKKEPTPPKTTEMSKSEQTAPVEIPQLKMTMSEAQRAGFQFKYANRSGNAVITSIHVKSDELIIPSYIDGHPVTVINKKCRCIINNGIHNVKLYLPDTIRIIGDSAFYVILPEKFYRPNVWQAVFSEVYFPHGFAVIGKHAFGGQKNLKALHFGERTYIKDNAFVNCTSLESVNLDGCSLGSLSFCHCKNLKNCTGSFSNYGFTDYAFSDTLYEKMHELVIVGNTLHKYNGSDKTVAVLNSIRYISAEAFAYNKSIENIILPDSVTGIGVRAFEGCTALKSINLSNVCSIHNGAFRNCSCLSDAKLKKDVYLEKGCFENTPFAAKNTKDSVWVGTIIEGTFLKYPTVTRREIYEFPAGVRAIADDKSDRSLSIRFSYSTVIFPETVERVDNISVFVHANKIIFRNPNVRVKRDERPFANIFRKRLLIVTFEIDGVTSEFPLFIPDYYRCEKSAYKQIILFYEHFFETLDVNFYDSGILDLELHWRHKLEIAYKRLAGGFKLSKNHRQMYEDFVKKHRKKGLKYAMERNDEEQIRFFEGLSSI